MTDSPELLQLLNLSIPGSPTRVRDLLVVYVHRTNFGFNLSIPIDRITRLLNEQLLIRSTYSTVVMFTGFEHCCPEHCNRVLVY